MMSVAYAETSEAVSQLVDFGLVVVINCLKRPDPRLLKIYI